jgi:hypothetical protein
MAETQDHVFDPLGDLFSSLWSVLPEETADDLAKFKKDVLTGIKSVVDTLIDEEIKCMERHVENARNIRREDDRACGFTDEAPPAPPTDPAPSAA